MSAEPKLLVSPKSPPDPVYQATTATRSVLALIFCVGSFEVSYLGFFKTNPLFGISYLAELLIAVLFSAIGFFIVPALFHALRMWFEKLIVETVAGIVSYFWYLQSKRIQDLRRGKQKLKAEASKKEQDLILKDSIVIDTSVLIDGRFLDLVKLGFVDNTLIIPEVVIEEMHLLSDSKDKLKRQKGRRGLDIVKELKKKTTVLTTPSKDKSLGADKNLVIYAKENNLRLATLDFNLGKVASVAGIQVLNINELANSLKSVLLPGEEVTIKIIQAGKEKSQGIGYLPDGTMLVVENAKNLVGQEVIAVVVKLIQSPAGKMIFCNLVPEQSVIN